jgi:hypothetical protein
MLFPIRVNGDGETIESKWGVVSSSGELVV